MADENLTNEETSSTDDLTEEQLMSLPDDEFMDYMNAKTDGTAIRSKHSEFVGDEIKDPNSQADEGDEDAPESSDDNSGMQQEEQAGASKEETPKEQEQLSGEPVEPTIDYKAAYESIMRPFKANGREIIPQGINDVISLMQMGANYTKKMQQFAPVRKVAETVTRNGINDKELNFLIDIHNGNKDAIKSLLKRHNIDPTEMMSDLEDDKDKKEYVPSNYAPSDSDMEISEIMADIDPDNMEKIKDIIANKWDAKSREELIKNPNILRGLNEELQLGRFDTIQAIVDNERVFGRHKDMSDLDLYVAVVTEYDKAQRQQVQQQYQQIPQQRSQATTPIPDKTKAAPTTKSRAQSRGRIRDSEIFKMSDEDFAKLKPGDILFNE